MALRSQFHREYTQKIAVDNNFLWSERGGNGRLYRPELPPANPQDQIAGIWSSLRVKSVSTALSPLRNAEKFPSNPGWSCKEPSCGWDLPTIDRLSCSTDIQIPDDATEKYDPLYRHISLDEFPNPGPPALPGPSDAGDIAASLLNDLSTCSWTNRPSPGCGCQRTDAEFYREINRAGSARDY